MAWLKTEDAPHLQAGAEHNRFCLFLPLLPKTCLKYGDFHNYAAFHGRLVSADACSGDVSA